MTSPHVSPRQSSPPSARPAPSPGELATRASATRASAARPNVTSNVTSIPERDPHHGRCHVDLIGRPVGRRVDPWWKDLPLDRRGLADLLLAFGVLVGVFVPIGTLIVDRWDGSSAGDADADVNRWFERRRTDGWDRAAEFGSMLSDTSTKLLLGVVLLPVCVWLFRRWHDWAFLVTALVFEATTFVAISLVVGRDRPPVEQLDQAPTASFPSGHIAAAVVFYVGLAIVMWFRTRNVTVRAVFAVVAVVAPAAVIVSRLYRGMHYPSDAVAGVLLGLVSLVVVRTVMVGVARRTRDA